MRKITNYDKNKNLINPQITQIFTDFLKKYFVLICGNLRNLRIYNFLYINLNKICVICGFIMFLFLSPQIARGDGGTMVISKYIKGDISDDPNSPMWGQSPAAKFPLFSQVIFEPRWFDGSVKEITVRSLNNGEMIAFLLEWEDKTENGEGEELMDGAALEFPVGKEKAYFAHAQRMELVSGGKVNIWHWKAGSPVKDMNAEGLGALTLQEHQDVAGKGVFSNGRWRVVFLRGLKSSDSKDTEFQVGEYKDIAFAIWDGANSEQGGQKTVSGWYYLQIEAPMSKMVYIYSVFAVIGAGLFEIFIIRRLKER